MDSGMLADLVQEAVTDYGIDSVTVVRNGFAVLDTVIYPFQKETAHRLQSFTKSVTATLIGIAINEGLLAGVDVPVVEVLSEAAPADVDEWKAAMTVEDLLTMSSGLDCRDSYKYAWQGLTEMWESDDWAAYVLALPMSEEPGTRFEYCNGASHLLSAIVSEVTGMPASQFAEEVLFGPLGITDYEWPADPQGISHGGSDLMLRPADMAKIGYLYLRDGQWDGEQIVAPSWVEAATTAQISALTLSNGYGYQLWVDDAGYVMALGYAGQYITVVPNHDLVVVFTSGLPPEDFHMPEILTNAYVVPAVVSDEPLPPDPEAEARLAAALAATSSGPDPKIVELPEVATAVDGVRYQIRPNDPGWEWFEILFKDDTAVLRTEDTSGLHELVVGMDGRYRVTDDLPAALAYLGDEVPVAMRGVWQTEDTFIIEFYIIGSNERGTQQFSFEDGAAHLQYREATLGTFAEFIAEPTT